MKTSFNDLGISLPILKAIKEMGFEAPTEVQSQTIPHVLNGKDLIVMSKTGSGKTAAFGVPMLETINPEAAGPQALILTPTRELAVQVDSDLKQLSKFVKHKTTAVYGQHNINGEIQALNKGVSIVTGTPGRVYDHIQHKNLVTRHIRFLVLDEADRMLDMGFIDQVVRIIKTLPKERVTLLFSATIPDEIKEMCSRNMKNPVNIEIESPTLTVDTIQQVYYRLEENEKRHQLNRVLLAETPESCLIFCNTRNAVDRVQLFLSRKGYASQALHGDIPQTKRLKIMQRFKRGEFPLLVATDVAARGIHIDELSLVINYDVPIEKDSYVHRIGRTGRAGHGGRAITFVTGEDIMSLYEIEEHIGVLIAESELPSDAFLQEHRAKAEKWIQAQKQPPKSTPSQVVSGSESKGNQNKRPPKKRSHKKRPQTEHQRERQVQNNNDHKPSDRARTVHPAERTKPVEAKIAKPAPQHPAKVASDSKPDTETAKNRKPFLQRVLQRIFGK